MNDNQIVIKNGRLSEYKLKYTELCISIIMLCCLTMNYIINIINSNILYILIMAFVILFFLAVVQRHVCITLKYTVLTQWWIAAFTIIVSTIRSPFNINTYVDSYAICICLIIMSFCKTSPYIFRRSMELIYIFSIYYALSIWVQILLPKIYDIFLRIIPESNSAYIINFQAANTGYTGFTTNPGFTAGYIVNGVILIFSKQMRKNHIGTLKNILILIFLLVSLLFTGKRGHLLSVIVAIIVVYISATNGTQKINRFSKVLLVVALSIIALLVFGEVFSVVPAFSRIVSTITGLIAGNDISNNRTRLYEFAIKLFVENPIFGVGWGQYRVLTVGNVTLVETIETHNIYLQMLCEMGIVGFICMIIPMFSSLKIAFKNVKENISIEGAFSMWHLLLLFSLGYQVFFLVYGLTGNPLYDHNCLLMYLFVVMISIVYRRKK